MSSDIVEEVIVKLSFKKGVLFDKVRPAMQIYCCDKQVLWEWADLVPLTDEQADKIREGTFAILKALRDGK